MKYMLKIATIAIAMSAATSAAALDLQNWSVKLGVNKITPKVQSSDMTAPSLPGTKVDVGSNTQPIFAFAYAYDSNLSAELVLGTPYKHDVYGAGSIDGVGKTGTVKSMPPTIFGQYHFLEEQARLRPYVGLGLTYAYFYDETGSAALTALTNTGSPTATTFSVDSAWGLSTQAGLIYNLDEKWFSDLVVVKTFLKTTAHFSTGQTVDMRLDPLAVSLSLGYRF
ncbi:MAG: outer membrane beta-barrel protein [Gammaproteobacteria bacterium]|nr:outer membrane beta-barrel protein [Gammaproteobacteria bacterium]MBU1480486.1 outer membrane beta-barrel protein [Gammaproteobacteria bacterium]